MSFSQGDTVYICGPAGPAAVTFIDQQGPDCIIEVDGTRLVVLCDLLHESPDSCPIDQGQLSVGDRVALQMSDGDGIAHTWPSDVRKIHLNGRVQVKLVGLSSPQTVDRSMLLRLGNK